MVLQAQVARPAKILHEQPLSCADNESVCPQWRGREVGTRLYPIVLLPQATPAGNNNGGDGRNPSIRHTKSLGQSLKYNVLPLSSKPCKDVSVSKVTQENLTYRFVCSRAEDDNI